ncbi:MAG: hypothetical protein ACFFBD_21840 [Candidatus Hodarchaeota archaeon]
MSSRTNSSPEQPESHDILNYIPDLLKEIDNTKMKILGDSKYAPLTLALKKGPMTIKQLNKSYAEITGATKSEKTLYRYLKTLIDNELVVSAGQRVVVGRRVNETLYALAARIFYSSDEYRFECNQKEKNMLVFLLRDCLGIRTASSDTMEHVFSSWRKNRKETIRKLATIIECNELKQLTSEINPEQASGLIDDVAFLAWLFSQSGISVQSEAFRDD